MRLNQIAEAQISLALVWAVKTAEGETYRDIVDLKLERARSPIFVVSWTVVHEITPGSPLYGKTDQDLRDAQAEVICSLSGIDETFSQTIHARFSYVPDDFRWGGRFQDILSRNQEGLLVTNFAGIHSYEIDTKDRLSHEKRVVL